MIDVACAIIVDKNGRIMAMQRGPAMSMPLKWEFPGGKVEPGETPEECLVREIKEEINVDIKILAELPTVIHHYPDFSIRLFPFKCKMLNHDIYPKEHQAYLWLFPKNLRGMDWAEADVPVLESYITEREKFVYRPTPFNVAIMIVLILLAVMRVLNYSLIMTVISVIILDAFIQSTFRFHFKKMFAVQLILILLYGVYLYIINTA